MNNPINHHYIPQFYIKSWQNSKGDVFSYARVRDKVTCQPKSPKSICSQKNLYTLQYEASQSPYIVETDFYSKVVDDPAAKVFHVLLNDSADCLNDEERWSWSRFVISLYSRSPDFVRSLKQEGVNILSEQILKHGWKYDSEIKPRDLEEAAALINMYEPGFAEDNILLHSIVKFDESKHIQSFLGLNWGCINYTSDTYSLITCDAPITIDICDRLRNAKTWILPISPNRVFVATENSDVIPTLSRAVELEANKCVKSLNQLTAMRAKRFVISNRKGLEGFLMKHFGEQYKDVKMSEDKAL